MKALTLHQPWASLIALGVKTIETRSWATSYRGPIAVHAAKVMPRYARDVAYADPIGSVLNAHGVTLGGDCAALPLGAIVATATLEDVVPIERINDGYQFQTVMRQDDRNVAVPPDQRPYGDFTPGRFAWLLEDIAPTTERCPACWGAGKIAGTVPGVPAAVCTRLTTCPVCWPPDLFWRDKRVGHCDPIPSTGHQGLWEWVA